MPRDHRSAALKERAAKLGLDMWAGGMGHWGLCAKIPESTPLYPRLPIVKFRTLFDVELFLDWYTRQANLAQASRALFTALGEALVEGLEAPKAVLTAHEALRVALTKAGQENEP